jgi:hypothetical protein
VDSEFIQGAWLSSIDFITPIYLVSFKKNSVIHYLKKIVGVVDFANAQGPEGPAGFEILTIK